MSGLIEAEADVSALLSRLTAKARSLATAQMQARALAQRGDARRWRRAGLIWPLFAKG